VKSLIPFPASLLKTYLLLPERRIQFGQQTDGYIANLCDDETFSHFRLIAQRSAGINLYDHHTARNAQFGSMSL